MDDGYVNLTTLDHFTTEEISVSGTGLGNLLRKVYSGDQIIGHKVPWCKKNEKKRELIIHKGYFH